MIKTTRNRRVFYAKGVNMSYSFDTLAIIAEQQMGELEVGDMIICDNVRMTHRKVLQKVSYGYLIMYGRSGHRMTALAERDGLITLDRKKIL